MTTAGRLTALRSNAGFFVAIFAFGGATLGGYLVAKNSQRQALAAERSLRVWQRELDELCSLTPPPTPETSRLITQELSDCRATIANLRHELFGKGDAASRLRDFAVPAPGADAFFALASHASRMREEAKAHQVDLLEGEAFGFPEYTKAGPTAANVAAVFQDRAVTEYLVRSLYSARPKRLISVGRSTNLPGENGASSGGNSGPDAADSAVKQSTETTRFVEATSYRIVFDGDTSVLRSLINGIGADDVPLIIRSLEVAPANADPGEGTAVPPGKPNEPLRDRSLSRYTVTVEFLKAAGQLPRSDT